LALLATTSRAARETVQLAVEGDDAAECRLAVGGVGQVIGLADAAFVFRHHCHAARIGVLDDHAGRLGKALHALQRGIGVGDVIERQLFALQLLGSGDAGFFRLVDIEGSLLVRVFTVAHVLRLDELHVVGTREQAAIFGAELLGALVDAAEVVGDHTVVAGSVLERLERQVEALGVGQPAVLQVVDHCHVVFGVDHNGDVLVVLRRAADHGRAADVDVLDSIRQCAAGLGYSGGERVEADRHQIDWSNAVLGHHRAVQVTTTKDAAVDLRMQGLHPSVHHLRETGVIGHFDGSDTVVTQQLEGTAGGEDLNTEGFELAGEVDDAGLVGHADQRAAHGEAGGLVGH